MDRRPDLVPGFFTDPRPLVQDPIDGGDTQARMAGKILDRRFFFARFSLTETVATYCMKNGKKETPLIS